MARISVHWRIAWRNLLEHKRRTLLLGAAIATVTALAILLAGLSIGIQRTLSETAVALATGHLNVNGVYKISPGEAVPMVTKQNELRQVISRSVPEAKLIVARGRGGAKLVGEGVAIGVMLNGVEILRESALKQVLSVVAGRVEDLSSPNTLLLFEHQAEKLSLKVGDTVTLSAQTLRGVANTIDCRVVAIARDVGLLSGGNAFTSIETLRTLYQVRSDVMGVFQIHLDEQSLDGLPQIGERLRRDLTAAGYHVMPAAPQAFWQKLEAATRQSWAGQRLDVSTWQDEVSHMMWSYFALRAASTLLLSILLAITIVGIMNSLWVATRERTREIGALRAIGMQRGGVAQLFLMEAGLLGLLSGGAGALIAVALTSWINSSGIRVPLSVQLFVMRDRLELAVDPNLLLLCMLLVTVATCAAALYPSLRAARLKPVDAMAHFS